MTVLEATQAGSGPHAPRPLNTGAGLTDVLPSTGLGMLMAVVLGITISSGESRHATATATYLANPDWTAVLIAKIFTVALAGLLFGLVTSGVATAIGLAFAAAKGYRPALGGITIARFAAAAVLGAGLLAAAGAQAAATRSAAWLVPAAITLAVRCRIGGQPGARGRGTAPHRCGRRAGTGRAVS